MVILFSREFTGGIRSRIVSISAYSWKGLLEKKRCYVKLLDDLREVYLLLNFVLSLGLQNLILSLLYWH